MSRILFIEPYYGGSHKSFADGYITHSSHEIELVSMPARKWKWRMRGAAMWLAGRLPDFEPELLLASDYLDLASFCSFLPPHLARLPRAVYFHENQLTYPLDAHTWRDYQYGLTNITSCLAADRVFFNSHYHRESFLGAVDELLRRMPDYVPKEVPAKILEKSDVVPVGIGTGEIDAAVPAAGRMRNDGPLHLVWNHRWEFDKGPGEFFEAMKELDERGAEFWLSVLGQAFRDVPDMFGRMERELGHRLRHFGFEQERRTYLRKLGGGDVVLSTASHEFFGISVLEAVYAGCVPLLPARLSYPELIPPHLHEECLYNSKEELLLKLEKWAGAPDGVRERNYKHVAEPYGWENVAPALDARLSSCMRRTEERDERISPHIS